MKTTATDGKTVRITKYFEENYGEKEKLQHISKLNNALQELIGSRPYDFNSPDRKTAGFNDAM